MIKAAVFDLWDTLVPSHVDMHHLRELTKHSGVEMGEYVTRYERAVQLKKYTTFEELRSDFLKEFGPITNDKTVLEEELIEVYSARMDEIDFFPEVRETLKQLRAEGLKLALLSNTESLNFGAIEKKLGLAELFDVVAPSFVVGTTKPNPEAFHFVLKKLKIEPREAIMVGDSRRADVGGANAAGMHSCLINRSQKKMVISTAEPEFSIHSLTELIEVINLVQEKEKGKK